MNKPNCLFVTPPLSKLSRKRRESVLKTMRTLQSDYWVYAAEPNRTVVEDDESGVRFVALHDSIASRFGELSLAVAFDNDLFTAYLADLDDSADTICLSDVDAEANRDTLIDAFHPEENLTEIAEDTAA